MKRTTASLGVIAVIASLALAVENARAGLLSNLTSAGDCAFPFVSSQMAPVDYFTAAGPKVCKSLCKHAASQCKGYVKGYAGCALASYKNENRYGLQNCGLISTSPAELKDCRVTVGANYKAEKTGLANFIPGQLDACAQWGDDCAAACAAPL